MGKRITQSIPSPAPYTCPDYIADWFFFRKIPIAYVGESSRKIQLVLTKMLTGDGCGYSFFAALPYVCK